MSGLWVHPILARPPPQVSSKTIRDIWTRRTWANITSGLPGAGPVGAPSPSLSTSAHLCPELQAAEAETQTPGCFLQMSNAYQSRPPVPNLAIAIRARRQEQASHKRHSASERWRFEPATFGGHATRACRVRRISPSSLWAARGQLSAPAVILCIRRRRGKRLGT